MGATQDDCSYRACAPMARVFVLDGEGARTPVHKKTWRQCVVLVGVAPE